MNKYIIKSLVVVSAFACGFTTGLYAQSPSEELSASLADSIKAGKGKKDNYWNRLINGHVDRTFEKKLDMSFAVAPSYTREASVGVGGMATGLYRLDRRDSLMMPSDIIVTFNASVNGYFSLEATGNNNFKGNRSRLSYQIAFYNKNLDFWGINYDDCDMNPVVSYQRQTVKVYTNYQYELLTNVYLGGILDFLYTNASKLDNPAYLLGQDRSFTATGIGLSLQYDSRDFILQPKRGTYLLLRQTAYPELLGNTHRTLWRTTLTADYYKQLWKGSVLAFDLYGQVSSNNLPWPLREELGGGERMRGYYIGRYIDNNIVSAQIEMRQHIAWRLGASAWVGCGTVFPSLEAFDIKKLLPTYGIGFRFEIKHNVNARIDFGFGKNTSGLTIGMGEAF